MDDVVTQFLDSAVSGSDEPAGGEGAARPVARMLADAFDLLRLLNLYRGDACLLLLDDGFGIIGAHSRDNPKVDGMLEKRFDALYKQGIRTHRITKFIRATGEGRKVNLYFYYEPEGEACDQGYYLCSITEREDDDVQSAYLATTAMNIRTVVRVITRYAGEGVPASGRGPRSCGFISERQQMAANKSAIIEALRLTGGNKRRAAQMLGVSRQTIYRSLRDWRTGGARDA
ncbi:MAG: helix-turn-helix domain-containing protein [Ignavibacteriales bacterium]